VTPAQLHLLMAPDSLGDRPRLLYREVLGYQVSPISARETRGRRDHEAEGLPGGKDPYPFRRRVIRADLDQYLVAGRNRRGRIRDPQGAEPVAALHDRFHEALAFRADVATGAPETRLGNPIDTGMPAGAACLPSELIFPSQPNALASCPILKGRFSPASKVRSASRRAEPRRERRPGRCRLRRR
jgi:hypothetical protein